MIYRHLQCRPERLGVAVGLRPWRGSGGLTLRGIESLTGAEQTDDRSVAEEALSCLPAMLDEAAVTRVTALTADGRPGVASAALLALRPQELSSSGKAITTLLLTGAWCSAHPSRRTRSRAPA
jgi:hypothetical protein